MYTLMLVDDEYMILKGIPKLLNWTELNIKIIKAERSPLAALEYLKDNQVDILLSDMNMAELSGIKFLPAVKKLQPGIQIIVLSGYEDFSYAKVGLEQGVVDYLNKPVDPDELEQAIQKAQKRVIAANKIAKQSSLANHTRIREILRGRLSLKTLDDIIENYYLLALVNPQTNVRQLLSQLDFVLGYHEEGGIIYIFIEANQNNLYKFNKQILPFISNELISPIFQKDDVVKWGKLIKKRAEEVKFYECSEKIVRLNNDLTSVNIKISADFRVGTSVEQFKSSMQVKLQELGEARNEIKDAKHFCRLVLMKIYGEHHKIDLDFTIAIAQTEDAKNITELLNILTSFFTDYQKSKKTYPAIIEQVIHYIDQNYMQGLTLKEVSQVMHISSVYLGAMFKKNLNQSFAQYLNSYRIARAIELMTESKFDINEIAMAVGYQNPNYFFRVFKQQTKMVPSDYRRMILENK